jgi:hypothetical protein
MGSASQVNGILGGYPVLGAARKGSLDKAVAGGVFHDFEAAEGIIRHCAPFADRNDLMGANAPGVIKALDGRFQAAAGDGIRPFGSFADRKDLLHRHSAMHVIGHIAKLKFLLEKRQFDKDKSLGLCGRCEPPVRGFLKDG